MEPTERQIAELTAEVEFLRSLVVILCVHTLPDDVLDTLIEHLDVPEFGDPSLSALNAVTDRLASKLAKGRARKRRSQG